MRRTALLVATVAGLAGVALLRRRRKLELAGRVVLITGGSRGLGLELAREFADQGAHIALLARDREELERAAQDLEGAQVELLQCDLRNPEEVEHAVEQLMERQGRIDVLVNCAGTIRVSPLANLSVDDFREEMNVNFFGALHATLSTLPHLERSGEGRIVNITSIGGRIPVPHLLPYTASKFAFVGFSEALQAELSGSPVRVTTVTPGLMRTGSPYRAMFGGSREREFRWFLLASSLPGVSMSAAYAARRIVDACRRGERSLILPAYLRLPIAIHALSPGAVGGVAGVVNQMLPEPTPVDGGRPVEGREVLPPGRTPAYAMLTKRAALRNNELG
ncbi:MAG: SDR family oxidoreductase [Trueperaceae bacterium]